MQKAFEELGGESGIYAEAYNDLAEEFNGITAADVEPVRRWIPCSERMPESYDEVLIWDGYDKAHYLGYYANANGWVVDGYEDDRYHFDITYWQPLPEPPEEGGTEK